MKGHLPKTQPWPFYQDLFLLRFNKLSCIFYTLGITCTSFKHKNTYTKHNHKTHMACTHTYLYIVCFCIEGLSTLILKHTFKVVWGRLIVGLQKQDGVMGRQTVKGSLTVLAPLGVGTDNRPAHPLQWDPSCPTPTPRNQGTHLTELQTEAG